MTIYHSDKLVLAIEEITNTKFSSAEKSAMKHKIREFFIMVHNESREATVIACNKKQYKAVEYFDK